MAIGSEVLDRALQKIGSWISINIGSEAIDSYGVGSYTFSAFSGEGYVRVLSDTDTSFRAGVLHEGDAIGYFRMNAGFPAGSKVQVVHQGVDYETLGEPVVPHISGSQLLQRIGLRRLVS